MNTVSAEQYGFLTLPVDPKRVQSLKGMSHMEAWDIRRTLIRAFGFGGYDLETKALDLVAQIQHTHDKDGNPIPAHRPRWTVIYRAEVRLTVKAPDGTVLAVYEDGASGDSQNQPILGDAHDMAMKTALSQALKRCAVNLGDQFGLGLYNNGRTDPVVHRTLNAPTGQATTPADLPVDEVLPEQKPAADPESVQQQARVIHPTAAPALGEKVAACTTRDHLAVVWKEIVAAVRDGQILPDAGELLKAQWKERDRHINAVARMFALLAKAEIKGREERISWYVQIIGRHVESTNELTLEEIGKISEKTEAWIDQNDPAKAKAGAAR